MGRAGAPNVKMDLYDMKSHFYSFHISVKGSA